MGPIEQGVRDSIEQAKQLAETLGGSRKDPNFHLTLIAGTMHGYVEKIEAEQRLLSLEQAEDLMNALYAILGDYEQSKLERELNGD